MGNVNAFPQICHITAPGSLRFASKPLLYPSPSTITITTTSGRSEAYLYTNLGGTGYFDIGTDTSYGLYHDPVTIQAGGTAWLAWDQWDPLAPDTLYHWRFTFTPATGPSVVGADQTFRTLPVGRATIGNGISSSCTEAALDTALSTSTDILFNCGTVPMTITLTSSKAIGKNVAINGDNKVTLAGNGASNHFKVQSGFHLTLTNLTLANGANNNYGDCGGSISVATNAWLSLSGARFSNNSSVTQGGAICVNSGGRADVQDSLFTTNHADSFGGALGNYGASSLTDSLLSGNTAGINGGGIDSTGTLTVTNSSFTGNSAVFRGGGVYNYLGTSTILSSTFISNTTTGYGGGMANDAGMTAIQASGFISNTASNVGGGIRNSGTMTVTNSTFSANHANNNGGGLDYSANTTLLNNTFNNNSAGLQGQGGNLFKGNVGATATLKNNILSGGSPNNCDSAVSSQGNNLESAASCISGGGGNIINANAKLGPLENVGGGSWLHALLQGSPAIDAGTNSGCPTTDQRGGARPLDGNGDQVATCDIGSYEYNAAAAFTLILTASPTAAGSVTASPAAGSYAPGTAVQITAAANPGYQFSGWTVDGSPAGTANPYNLTMNANHTLVANYAPASAGNSFRVYIPLAMRR